MPIAMITGAARGLGLGLAERYVDAGWDVIAAVRDTGAGTLAALRGRHPARLSVEHLDLADFDSIDNCARRIGGRQIDVLIGSAAATRVSDRGFGQTDYDDWAAIMRVNTFAQLRLAEAFVEHVARSERRIMYFVSSRVGARPIPGMMIAYRSSKSALNQVVYQLALQLQARGICVACGHPGFVQTDATQGQGAFTVRESAERLFALIDRLQLTDSGKFFEPDGSELPIVTRQSNPRAVGGVPIADE